MASIPSLATVAAAVNAAGGADLAAYEALTKAERASVIAQGLAFVQLWAALAYP
jgi:hypothetical protein